MDFDVEVKEEELILDEYSQAGSECELPSEDEEEDFDVEYPDDWHPRSTFQNTEVYQFIGDQPGLNSTKAPSLNKHSHPFDFFRLLFNENILDIIVRETNVYYHQHMKSLGRQGSSLKPDVTKEDMMKFLAISLLMGHTTRDTIKEYWSKDELYRCDFYGQTMPRDRFQHILCYLHFDNNAVSSTDSEAVCGPLRKIRAVFEKLNNSFSHYYNPTENLGVGEVTILFKDSTVFRQYRAKTPHPTRLKIYKLCDQSGYTVKMYINSCQQMELESPVMISTHEAVINLMKHAEGKGHKLFMDSHFSSPNLFNYLFGRNINACGKVRANRMGMPPDWNMKLLSLKKGDLVSQEKDHLVALAWKDHAEMYLLSNMHQTPEEGNFIDENGNARKPEIVKDYYKNSGYVHLSDRMVNSYTIARKTWKWTKKIFFHLLNMTVVNSFLLYRSVCGPAITLKQFREQVIRGLINLAAERIAQMPYPKEIRKVQHSSQLLRLDCRHNRHWPEHSTRRRCAVCAERGRRRTVKVKCGICDIALCFTPCFRIFHTKINMG